ncbi:MAG: sugar phosphate nucleotidyltransferase [Bacteroidota bacterium]
MASRRWAIILAAGDGERVRRLTKDGRGRTLPKQFWAPGDAGPMLRWAYERAKRLTRPARIVTVVSAHHRQWWADLLPGAMAPGLIVQPENRGTAAGILLPLLHVLRHHRDAIVILLPADQYVADEKQLRSSLEHACSVVERGRRIVLLGMAPHGPEPDYGWIVAGEAEEDGTRRVVSFVEKPGSREARELYRSGASVSSFMLVARGRALLALYQAAAPALLATLARVTQDHGLGEETGPSTLARAYASLSPLDFSRDVLQPSASLARVLAVPPCGWTDLGTPERLERWIRSRADGGDGRPATLETSA